MQFRIKWERVLAETLRLACAMRLRSAYRVAAARILFILAVLHECISPMITRSQAVFDNLTPRQLRISAATSAVLLHVLLAVCLVIGFEVKALAPIHDLEMALGGPIGIPTLTPKPPQLVMPETPAAPPPVINIADSITSDLTMSAGSPNVTVPAEAIAEAHKFPPLPAAFKSREATLVRLLISITESGMIDNAKVQGSSGISALDAVAVDWVKTHWRYRPAFRNGMPIAVVTTAIVVFSNT